MSYSIHEAKHVLEGLLRQADSQELAAIIRRVLPSLPNSQYYRDYKIGLQSLFDHIVSNAPEILQGDLKVVEVGPGVGCFMVVARALGNTVIGEELDRGNDRHERRGFVDAYYEITRFWGLDIHYHGFHRYLDGDSFPYAESSIDLFHFRGSLDGILLPFSNDVPSAVSRLIALLVRFMKKDGCTLIHHNVDSLLPPVLAALREQKELVLTIDEPRISRLVRMA